MEHKILIVDDDQSVLKFLMRAFDQEPYQVLSASDARSALEVLEQHNCALVLSDQRMPGGSGTDLLKEVQTRWPHCARIILTAYADPDSIISAVNEGCVHRYLLKPCDSELLLETVRELLATQNSEPSDPPPTSPLPITPMTSPARDQSTTEEIEQLQNQFLELYHNSPDGHCSFLTDGLITEVNATLLQQLGYQREEVIGRKRFTDFFAPAEAPKVLELVKALSPTGVGYLDTSQVKRDGKELPTRLTCHAVFDGTGALTICHATLRDITEEKQLLARLIHSQKAESIGRLAGGIAHDFNNMLTGILGFTGFAIKQLGENHEVSQTLLEVERAADRASSLVAQILTHSRQQNGTPEPTDLNSLITESANFLQRTLPATIQVSHVLCDQLGITLADQNQMQQILLNLCVNASDAMNQSGSLTIKTENAELDEDFVAAHPPAKAGRYVAFSVQDTGSGMDEQMISKIFEPFFTTKAVGKGTGLGLAIVYDLVKNHNGFITVNSQPGQGTIFAIYLPVYQLPCSLQQSHQSAHITDQLRGTETVLYVDNEPIIADLAQQVLTEVGFHVLTATSVNEAMEMYFANPGRIDVIVSDVMEPDKSGTELYEELVQLNPDVRVILSTGYGNDPDLSELSKHGVPVIQKPYQMEQMVKLIRETLDQPVAGRTMIKAEAPTPLISLYN